jgi:hypothetical protein
MTSAAVAADVAFSSGNNFSSIPIRGQVEVTCADGTLVQYSCHDTVLDPASYDYFVAPQGSNADQVSLSNLRADGSRRNRSSDYDAKAGHSSDAFNLWISTIFQKPLLQMGVNKVDYTLSKDGKTTLQGTFSVKVSAGTLRECPKTHYNSTEPVDCQSQYTVCQRYFEQYQNCR